MIEWLFDTIVATGVLIAVILLIRRPVARWFGPGVAYCLWALPIIRLFLPPLVLPASMAASEPTVMAPPVLAADVPAAAAPVALPVAVAAEAALPWAQIAVWAWAAGALAFLGWRTWGYVAMRRALLADAIHVGRAGKVRIVESPGAFAPVAFGVFDKVVALPVDFLETADAEAADFAIAHELEHHAGNDLAANIAMQPLLALHWFNPLGWLAWRAMRADQEAACDARVLAGCGGGERARYGRLIASFAGAPKMAMAAPMAGPLSGDKPIVHRLKALTRRDESPRRRALGRGMIGLAALGLPATATISYAAVEPVDPDQEHRVVKVSKNVIIEKDADAAASGDGKTYEHVVKRGDKTFAFKTDSPMSEAQIDAEIARAEAEFARAEAEADRAEAEADHAEAEAERMEREIEREQARIEARSIPTPPRPPRVSRIAPVPPVAPTAPVPPAAPKIAREFMALTGDRYAGFFQNAVATVSYGGGGLEGLVNVHVDEEAIEREAEKLGECVEKTVTKRTLEGLREARRSIARDKSLPEDVRRDVLRDLDASIREQLAEQRRMS